jgi:hypothetical protein
VQLLSAENVALVFIDLSEGRLPMTLMRDHTMHQTMHDDSEYRRIELITGRRKRRT